MLQPVRLMGDVFHQGIGSMALDRTGGLPTLAGSRWRNRNTDPPRFLEADWLANVELYSIASLYSRAV